MHEGVLIVGCTGCRQLPLEIYVSPELKLECYIYDIKVLYVETTNMLNT